MPIIRSQILRTRIAPLVLAVTALAVVIGGCAQKAPQGEELGNPNTTVHPEVLAGTTVGVDHLAFLLFNAADGIRDAAVEGLLAVNWLNQPDNAEADQTKMLDAHLEIVKAQLTVFATDAFAEQEIATLKSLYEDGEMEYVGADAVRLKKVEGIADGPGETVVQLTVRRHHRASEWAGAARWVDEKWNVTLKQVDGRWLLDSVKFLTD